MVQDTRKDPRAKVLSMTVRYRSATVDEFIEHHSHDISRGGMFIKTPSPFPPGTLLKFEVRIAEEQKLMQGVGRVVWKRDPSSSSSDMPTGMGVKFIKIDEESKRIIDRLVAQRGNGESAFEQGQREETPRSPAVATPSPQAGTGMLAQAAAAAAAAGGAADVPRPVRKGTVIGLGAMHPPPEVQAAAQQASEPFFPKGEPAEQPAPEDRTVMKQAAELLQEALREAGGSLDEVMGPADGKTEAMPAADQTETPMQEPVGMAPANGGMSSAETRAPTEQLPAAEAPTVKMETVPKSEREPEAFREREPARPAVAEAPMPEQKGSMSIVWMLLGVVVIGGGIYFFTQQRKPPPEEALPAPVAQPPTPAKPVAAPKPDEAALKAAEEARKAEEAAKAAEAAKAEEEAKKAAEEEAKKAEEEAKKAAAKAAPRPRRPRPKPVTSETETETESTGAPADTAAPTATAAPAPTTPKSESTGAPKTSPSPAPTPTSGPDKLY